MWANVSQLNILSFNSCAQLCVMLIKYRQKNSLPSDKWWIWSEKVLVVSLWGLEASPLNSKVSLISIPGHGENSPLLFQQWSHSLSHIRCQILQEHYCSFHKCPLLSEWRTPTSEWYKALLEQTVEASNVTLHVWEGLLWKQVFPGLRYNNRGRCINQL